MKNTEHVDNKLKIKPGNLTDITVPVNRSRSRNRTFNFLYRTWR
jgi:hypothetical protein